MKDIQYLFLPRGNGEGTDVIRRRSDGTQEIIAVCQDSWTAKDICAVLETEKPTRDYEAEIESLEAEIESLEADVADLEDDVDELKAENTDLKAEISKTTPTLPR